MIKIKNETAADHEEFRQQVVRLACVSGVRGFFTI